MALNLFPMPFICPTHWRKGFAYNGIMPVWMGVYPVACWYTYLRYDNERVMIEHYESMKKLVDYFSDLAREDHILTMGLGDHMEPAEDGTTNAAPQHTPASLTSTAWYYFNTWIVAQAAKIAGKDDEYRHYSR